MSCRMFVGESRMVNEHYIMSIQNKLAIDCITNRISSNELIGAFSNSYLLAPELRSVQKYPVSVEMAKDTNQAEKTLAMYLTFLNTTENGNFSSIHAIN